MGAVNLLLAAFTNKMAQDGFHMPILDGRLGGGWQYSFAVKGIILTMQVGKGLPENAKTATSLNYPHRFIWTGDGEKETMQTLRRFMLQHADYKSRKNWFKLALP